VETERERQEKRERLASREGGLRAALRQINVWLTHRDDLQMTAIDVHQAVLGLYETERQLDPQRGRPDRSFPDLFPFGFAFSEPEFVVIVAARWPECEGKSPDELRRNLLFELCRALGPPWSVAFGDGSPLRRLVTDILRPPRPPGLRLVAEGDEQARAFLDAYARGLAASVVPVVP
jgi:hypothetical protein